MIERKHIYALIFPLSMLGFSAYPSTDIARHGMQLAQQDDIYNTDTQLDDTTLTTRVKSALLDEPSLRYARINVETNKGIVHLSGIVNKDIEVKKAVEITQNINGVQAVKNELKAKR